MALPSAYGGGANERILEARAMRYGNTSDAHSGAFQVVLLATTSNRGCPGSFPSAENIGVRPVSLSGASSAALHMAAL